MQTKLIVQNLKCGGCAGTISKHLNAIGTVSNVEVETEESSVSFSYDNESCLSVVEEKLKQIGYPVFGDSNTYLQKAKSFISCATGKINQ